MVEPVRKAVFPVGGLGTRFLPATKAVAKEMLPVIDKPLIQYTVEEAQASGIEQFIFVTGRGKSSIEKHFDHAVELGTSPAEQAKARALKAVSDWLPEPGRVSYTIQPEPLGLGHAVWCARELVGDEPFAVVLTDDLVLSPIPCLKQLLDVYQEKGGNVVAVEDVPKDQTHRYGILDVAGDDGRVAEIKGLVEKPKPEEAPSTLSIIGRYILQPQVFRYLDRHQRGAGGEIQLTDAMASMIGDFPFHGLRFEGRRFDCGSKIGFLEASVAYALERDDLRDDVLRFLRSMV
ncbi:MAG: UTP--glucose-1-phosphate uridylyltransferase GalU [Alphaproteobacteria bacterium]|nr:UTP--glucose-1-phosphate uridylyltransferase GalU [Pseudomonadota bacterium]MCH7633389.1 UTP--glucose-1-phosphate uridylyltransferase GalU [Pseudomonadota bacterium]